MSSVSRHKPELGLINSVDGNYDQLMALIQDTITRRMKSFRECGCCGRQAPQELLGSCTVCRPAVSV